VRLPSLEIKNSWPFEPILDTAVEIDGNKRQQTGSTLAISDAHATQQNDSIGVDMGVQFANGTCLITAISINLCVTQILNPYSWD
jgi:hypothetical protein